MMKNMKGIGQDFMKEIRLTLETDLFNSRTTGIIISPFDCSVEDRLKTLSILRRGETPPRGGGIGKT